MWSFPLVTLLDKPEKGFSPSLAAWVGDGAMILQFRLLMTWVARLECTSLCLSVEAFVLSMMAMSKTRGLTNAEALVRQLVLVFNNAWWKYVRHTDLLLNLARTFLLSADSLANFGG